MATQALEVSVPIITNLSHSEQIGDIATALAAATLDFKSVKKESVNPYFKSKYADLSAVIEATYQGLAKNKVSVIQSPVVNGDKAGVTTMLVHASGQWMRGDLLLPVTKWDAQGIGSAITYARRYSLQSFLNVAAEADDDANAAAGKETEAKAATMPRPPARKPVTEAPKGNGGSFSNLFWAKAKAAGKSDQTIRDYIGQLGYEHTEEIPPFKRNEAMEWAGETR